MEKNKISDEEFERIKNHIDRYSYLDLVMWRNDMINSGNVNNRLFDLIDHELLKRNAKLNEERRAGKSK